MPSLGFPYRKLIAEVKNLLLGSPRGPRRSADDLTGVCGERLAFREPVPKETQIPDDVFLRCIARAI